MSVESNSDEIHVRSVVDAAGDLMVVVPSTLVRMTVTLVENLSFKMSYLCAALALHDCTCKHVVQSCSFQHHKIYKVVG